MVARTKSLDEFYLEVVRGNIPGHRSALITGFSDVVGATETTLMPFNVIYQFPTSASIIQVASTSANDTSAGTGARTIQIFGLDANYVEINEVITLNGQTPVSSVNQFLRVNVSVITTAGSSGVNAGTVYVGTGTFTVGVPAVKLDIVSPGKNYTQVGVYTVPANHTLVILQSSISVGSGKDVIVDFAVRPFGGLMQKRRSIVLFQASEVRLLSIGAYGPEKIDLDIRALSSSATNGNVYCTLDGILVNNNFKYLG